MSGTDLTVISLFAGCGGSSLGYKQAGYQCRAAVEWDAHAASVYRLNFPSTPVLETDIQTLTGSALLEAANMQPGHLDVLDGSPPCQSFSTAGKRRLSDPRGNLFADYTRLLRELQPRAFVAENVSGLVKGTMRGAFKAILADLQSAGYRVRCRLMDAQYLGVPQHRERLIFIGIRNDLGLEPSHPLPSTMPMSAGEALALAPDTASLTGRVGTGYKRRPVPLDKPLPTLQASGAAQTRFRLELTDGYAHNQTALSVADATLRAGRPLNLRTRSMSINSWRPGPAATITATSSDYRGLDDDGSRRLTIDEAKCLQGFPPDFQLTGTYTQQWARIGNSVAPPMMKAIAEHLRDLLTNQTARREARS